MAGGASSSDSDEIVGINVTPLVDIMLVLLIVFMVTAKLINSSGIPLDLPKGATGTDQVQTVFSVVLAADGTTMVDSTKVGSEEAILPLAKDALAKTPDLRAVIKADTTVQHGRVIKVLDILKQAKISKIAFGVSPVPAQGPAQSPAPTPAPSK